MFALLSDPDVWAHVADKEQDSDRVPLRETLVEMVLRTMEENIESEERFPDLRQFARPGSRDVRYGSAPVVRRLIREAEIQLDRRPEYALELVASAEQWTSGDDDHARLILGDVWKHRSNALRQLGRYMEALDAAKIAESFYDSVPTSEFDIGQARFTYAVALIKMNRNAEALEVLASAERVLAPFGASVPLAKAAVLRAGIFFQQGDFERAEQEWQAIIPALIRLGDEVELARVRANLAECQRMRGAYDDALATARAAIDAYRTLGMDTEIIRTQWTVANVLIGRGDTDAGLDELYGAAAEFEILAMYADAGFVKLDIAEELLRREEWRDAALVAREVVNLFARAGVTAGSIQAVSFLRTAVEREHATISLVRYVREYVTCDDPSRLFLPPGA
jgi:tetratricopeptide (TPR) repeat protein